MCCTSWPGKPRCYNSFFAQTKETHLRVAFLVPGSCSDADVSPREYTIVPYAETSAT